MEMAGRPFRTVRHARGFGIGYTEQSNPVAQVLEQTFSVPGLADTLNAMMALPNLVALLSLSSVSFRLTRGHLAREQ